MKDIQFYRCEKCGNIFAQLNEGGGEPVCCGQKMTKLTANTTDAAREKHVPVVSKEGGKIKAAVGSVLHPMLPEHHIEWIALVTEGSLKVKFLKPGMEPKAEFCDAASGTVYEYCNLHGLWKADF